MSRNVELVRPAEGVPRTAALKSMQYLGTEYHFGPADRRVLVRITGRFKPSLAKQFEAAVAGL